MGVRNLGRRFRRRHVTKRRKHWKTLLVIAVLLVAGWVAFSEWGLGSISEELTQEAARGYVLARVNEAVEESMGEEGAFVSVENDETGSPVAVRTDTAALNQLRAQILSRLEETLNGSVTVEVPAGSLTGVALLNGHGFPVPLTMRMESSADLSFETEFVSAGINQSCHRITMTITVQTYSQSKRFETQAQVETSTVLAETVLVGNVPEGGLFNMG